MSKLLSNYCDADFPLEVQWQDHGKVRLVAGFPKHGEAGTVVGYSYSADCEGNEYVSQALTWDGLGRFSGTTYPEMDLPPPPATVADQVEALQGEAAAIRDRLFAYPDAPAEWRSADEMKLRRIEDKIKRLRPDLADAA